MEKTDDGLELLALVVAWLGSIGISAMILYGVGAASEPVNQEKFYFYGILAVPVILWKLVDVYLQNRGLYDRYPELTGFGFVSFHSPDQTPIGKRVPDWVGWKVLFSLFFAVAMVFGLVVNVSGQIAVGTPDIVTASVSPGASLGLAVEPAVFSETLFFNIGMPFFIIGVLWYALRSVNVSRGVTYVVSHAVAIPVSSVGFLIYHSFRYGAVEQAQASILMQGFIYNSLTVVTHSAIPAYLIHGSGNFFAKAAEDSIFSPEQAVLVASIGFVASMGVFSYLVVQNLSE